MSRQPEWRLIANLGDENPLDYGGLFVFVDELGQSAPQCEYVDVNDTSDDEEPESWIVYRFELDRCTYVDGVLSDNPHHPETHAWFAKPESERAGRPQDTTYLQNIADFIGADAGELVAQFCSDDPIERAQAWRAVGDYHGWDNLDNYPLDFTSRKELAERYIVDPLDARTVRGALALDVVRDATGKIINRSRNLAGIRRYVSRNAIDKLAIDHLDNGRGRLSIDFDNGAEFRTQFADFGVLCEFVRRWRNVYGAPLEINGFACGKVSSKALVAPEKFARA